MIVALSSEEYFAQANMKNEAVIAAYRSDANTMTKTQCILMCITSRSVMLRVKADIDRFALLCLVVDRLNVSMLKETRFPVSFCAFCIFMRANSGFKDTVLGLAKSLLEWRQDK